MFIFSNCTKPKTHGSSVIERTQKYMFTNTNRTNILNQSNEMVQSSNEIVKVDDNHEPIIIQEIPNAYEPVNESDNTIQKPIELKEDPPIVPNQKDTLFWCLYIAIFGYNDYLQISRNYGVKELEIKQKIGEYIKENPSKLKNTNYKVTKASIQEILSELLTSQKDTSMLCLIAMTVYFNINVILINSEKKTLLEFLYNKDSDVNETDSSESNTFVLYKDSYNKYTIQPTPASAETIANIKQTNICLENYLKPLRAISTYKIDELCKLAERLQIEKQPKPAMYELINTKLLW
jgi:hypothetical protein